jgi:aspartate kinase
MNQILVSFSPKDFSFIVEENLSDIFNRLSKLRAKINVMQNSALNFSVSLDGDKVDTEEIIREFSDQYKVKYNQGLELITIRHYDEATIKRTTLNKEIVLEQRTRQTVRFLVKDLS